MNYLPNETKIFKIEKLKPGDIYQARVNGDKHWCLVLEQVKQAAKIHSLTLGFTFLLPTETDYAFVSPSYITLFRKGKRIWGNELNDLSETTTK